MQMFDAESIDVIVLITSHSSSSSSAHTVKLCFQLSVVAWCMRSALY